MDNFEKIHGTVKQISYTDPYGKIMQVAGLIAPYIQDWGTGKFSVREDYIDLIDTLGNTIHIPESNIIEIKNAQFPSEIEQVCNEIYNNKISQIKISQEFDELKLKGKELKNQLLEIQNLMTIDKFLISLKENLNENFSDITLKHNFIETEHYRIELDIIRNRITSLIFKQIKEISRSVCSSDYDFVYGSMDKGYYVGVSTVSYEKLINEYSKDSIDFGDRLKEFELDIVCESCLEIDEDNNNVLYYEHVANVNFKNEILLSNDSLKFISKLILATLNKI